MAKIPLRTYIKDVENLIERGEIDKAVTHAKNILKTYPKHIETYRLLGKAYLESQRYSDATDILQRVLSVIPDDFVSQIGMSIIREDEANLDAAIWHMERAYEVQPFNPAVQDELRRLYGRRDGVEPPKIRLTRGALIRMYARGELYPQAIAETRAALAEDPQRQDLQVLLARLYFLNGQKVEAAEVCSSLIGKLPYCYEANLILAEVLPGTSRAEDARTFQQRLYALDPYAAYLSPSAQAADQVPDQAVMVEQFLFEAELEQSDQRPEWTKNVGVEWQEEEEQLPDWLNTLAPQETAAAPAVASQPQPDEEESVPQDLNGVPDWMKAAGWTKSDRSADEIAKEQLALTASQDSADEEAAPAEIPDWLQTMAPTADTDQQGQEQERLNMLESILPSSQPQDEEPSFASDDDDTLVWLTGAASTTALSSAAGITIDDESDALPQDNTDWLSGLDTTGQVPASADVGDQVVPATDLPEWLSMEEPVHPAVEETPDWLSHLGKSDESPTAPPPVSPSEDWLSQVGEETPTAAETTAGMPDWMKAVDKEPVEDTDFSPSTAWMSSLEDEKAADDLLTSTDLTSADQITPTQEPLPDWLKGAETDIIIPAPIMPSDEFAAGDQVSQLSSDETVVEGQPELDLTENVTISPVDEVTQTTPDLTDMDAAMAWLESLAAKQGADEATLVTRPEDRLDTPPNWVSQEDGSALPQLSELPEAVDLGQSVESAYPAEMEQAATGSTEIELPVASEQQPVEETPLPDWLGAVDQEPVAGQPSTAWNAAAEPETLDSLENPAAEQAQVTAEIAPVDQAQQAAVPDFSDMDSAMAWLESLAAKQGADEATLVTPPEDRLDTPPDWVTQQTVTQEEPTQPVRVSHPAEQEPMPVEKQVENVEEAPEPPLTQDAFPSDEIPGEDALLPDWIQPETQATTQEAELPDWLSDEILIEQEAELADQTILVVPPTDVEESTAGTVSEPETAAMPDFSDMDSAMAWLESLAAKQGADEATLVTPPEDRIDTPPDWVAQELAQSETLASEVETRPEMPAQTEIVAGAPAWSESEPETTQPDAQQSAEAGPEAAQAETTAEPGKEMNFDATFAWLESLAARQGAEEGSLVTAPEERQVETPEWVQSITAEESISPVEPAEHIEQQVSESTGWQTEEETPATEAAAVPSWFEAGSDEEAAIDQAAPTNVDDIPVEWLPEVSTAVEEPVVTPTEELPAWLQQVEAEESLPAGEPQEAPKASLEDWLHSLESESAIPTVSGQEEETPVLADAWQEAPTPEPVVIDTNLTGQAALTAAQAALNHGRLDPALEIYNRFIGSGEFLDEVIHDLRDALYRYPVDITVWQALGDAFARNNQLQEALDAYTKAEELLR